VIPESTEIVRLTRPDIGAALRLSEAAGWNQTADDWRLFIEAGKTFGLRDQEGRLLATAAAMPYRGRIGYVAMVIVDPAWRRRGFATRLVDACIEELEGLGLVPVLDATPDGEPVYSRRGFRPLYRLDRWQGDAQEGGVMPPDCRDARPSDLATIIRLDADAFGSARPALIEDCLFRPGTRAIVGEEGDCFAMIRNGRRARQLGPVVAPDEGRALAMISGLIAGETGSVFVDVPSRWGRIGSWLGGRGFGVQRSLACMARGATEPFGTAERLFALAGPEFG
jgi:GNAT superfamily N-acetyltransferase